MKRRIAVTRDHIENGQRNGIHNCPIALALASAGYPGAEIRPTTWQSRPLYPGHHPTHKLPVEAQNFIENFDDNLPVTPFTFLTEVPE